MEDETCTSIEMAEHLPEPIVWMNCADDSTDDAVRYERRFPMMPITTKSTQLGDFEMRRYGAYAVPMEDAGSVMPGYRTASTSRIAGTVFLVMLIVSKCPSGQSASVVGGGGGVCVCVCVRRRHRSLFSAWSPARGDNTEAGPGS